MPHYLCECQWNLRSTMLHSTPLALFLTPFATNFYQTLSAYCYLKFLFLFLSGFFFLIYSLFTCLHPHSLVSFVFFITFPLSYFSLFAPPNRSFLSPSKSATPLFLSFSTNFKHVTSEKTKETIQLKLQHPANPVFAHSSYYIPPVLK